VNPFTDGSIVLPELKCAGVAGVPAIAFKGTISGAVMVQIEIPGDTMPPGAPQQYRTALISREEIAALAALFPVKTERRTT
jgi:hypothetical protein